MKIKNAIGKIALTAALICLSAIGEEYETHTFTNVNEVGTFSIQEGKYAKAEIVLVGGGGAGGTVGLDVIQGAAGGGGGGGISHRTLILEGGTYFVNVGRGGQKAQNATSSWVGDDGEYTTLAFNSETNFIATVKGGGGGGSVKVGGSGTSGSSGGGGSWYGSFLPCGSGTDGYGWNGGTPTDINVGGGGGGAVSTGGADGTMGEGREIYNTIYARGGRGGNRGEQNYEPKDGEGYGFGGDGAVNGLGGKGGDGIAIVKILKTFTYTDVKIPVDGEEQGYTFSFPSNGLNIVGFDLSKANSELRNGIELVEGVTNATDVGQYKFTLYLKEEYRWEDGSIDPKTFGWRINEPNVIGNITVDVKKTVDWFEGTNATIAIDIHSTPEKKEFIPNVLVLGSLCDAHDLTSDIVKTTLNTITEVGNADYYYFNESSTTASLSGSLSKGQKYTRTVTVKTSNHWTAYGFYNQLWTLINNGTAEKYDYIIFSFDRSRVVGKYTTAHSHEADVVNFLIPYYEGGKVIWLVDKDPENYSTTRNNRTYTIGQTPWYPCDLYPYTQGSTTTWRTFRQHISNDTQAYTAYHGMIGLFSPMDYARITRTVWDNGNLGTSLEYTDVANVGRVAGQKNPNQVVYDNANNVADVISSVVKPTVATLEAHDQIYIKNGLRINDGLTDAYYTTNEQWKADSWDVATERWTKLNSTQLTYSDENGINISISNIVSEAWVKLKVGVTDTGKFLTSVDAKWNERTGKWEKDPNNGPVRVEMLPDNGTKVIAEDEARTIVDWSFEAFKITGNVIYGDGEFIINGFYTNMISVAKGYNPEAMFKGAPGWEVCHLEVDGQVIDKSHYITNWFFGNISADHDIKVAFTNIVQEVPPPEVGPTTYLYDGNGHTIETLRPPTFVEGYEEYSNRWHMVYTTDPDADPSDRNAWTSDGIVTNVGTTTVYARICLEQNGYEDGAIVPYWIGTNTVTIIPRPIEIKIDDQWQTSDTKIPISEFTFEQTDGTLCDGDFIEVEYPNFKYPTSQGGTSPINGTMKILHMNEDGTTTDVTSNYSTNVVPGTYHYPDSKQVIAIAPDIVKTYDGKATNTIVKVINPDHMPTVDEIKAEHKNSNQYNNIQNINETKKIEYYVDGIWTTTPPKFTDVGEYDVRYRVSYSYTFQHRRNGLYQWTTDTVTYTPYEGTAKVTVLPREVVITAESSEKTYDGTPLTNPNYTVTGLADGETITAHMTSDSAITDIGSTSNKVDRNITYNEKFNPDNYNIRFVDGTLTVTDITNGGGSEEYLDGKALMIVDHDPYTNGCEYLAFNPRYKKSNTTPFDVWLERTVQNHGIKFKYGRTPEECDECNPVPIELSDVPYHIEEMGETKIWIKIPLENISNVGTFTKKLVERTAYVKIFIEGKADSWFDGTGLSKDGAVSINTHGIFKIDLHTTNTMVAVPWTWYSETHESATDIPAKKIVKSSNLGMGDYVYLPDGNDYYRAWLITSKGGVAEFESTQVIRIENDSLGRMQFREAEDETDRILYSDSIRVKRGYGIWLHRQNPNAPIYVYGQYTPTKPETIVYAPSADEMANPNSNYPVHSNMIGNPFMKDVKLNDIKFSSPINSGDRIKLHNEDGINKDIIYENGKGWREYTTKVVNGVKRNGYTYQTVVPAGMAFWYDRRGSENMIVIWGEGEDEND